jgi:hypothetical protein
MKTLCIAFAETGGALCPLSSLPLERKPPPASHVSVLMASTSKLWYLHVALTSDVGGFIALSLRPNFFTLEDRIVYILFDTTLSDPQQSQEWPPQALGAIAAAWSWTWENPISNAIGIKVVAPTVDRTKNETPSLTVVGINGLSGH